MGSKIRRKKKITQEKEGNKKHTANQPSYKPTTDSGSIDETKRLLGFCSQRCEG